MKKRLYVLLALGVMTAVLITGCASSANNTANVATESTAASESGTTRGH